MKRGSLSPDAAPRFKKVVPGQKIADTQQNKALKDLALAANRRSQLKRNINLEIANALKTGLSKSTLRFYDRVADDHSREFFISPGPSRPRPTATSKLESLLLHSPHSAKILRKDL